MGGVFGLTRGLLGQYGSNRIIDTPISENGFTTMAVATALRGLRPI